MYCPLAIVRKVSFKYFLRGRCPVSAKGKKNENGFIKCEIMCMWYRLMRRGRLTLNATSQTLTLTLWAQTKKKVNWHFYIRWFYTIHNLITHIYGCTLYWNIVSTERLKRSHCERNKVSYHTIITPTKCTLLLLKALDITICTLSYILPLHVSTRVGHLQGAQCQCLAKVIINYNLLKLC
jgi:hypothetical protein